ncbi:MAG: DNA gyrase inhibitor YacG [Phycisphaerae bacterium]|jgi:endogenous inhibitor of DNA gyrase (YacG/DUF329 family)
MISRRTCPVCDKALPVESAEAERAFPFCSLRCRQIDFFRWADGKYAVVEQLDPEVVEFLSAESGDLRITGGRNQDHSEDDD